MSAQFWQDPTNLLSAYQNACRSFDVDAAVSFFSADGQIEFAGEVHAGVAALRDAHLWDRGAQNYVAFIDLTLVEDIVYCTFVNQHELHRVLGVDEIRSPAQITIHAGQITSLRILEPEAESRQMLREKAASFLAWVRVHQPEAWQRTAVLDEVGGRTLYALAHAWKAATFEETK